MNYWLFIIIPLLTAFAGWITIRLGIRMLFHPRKPRKILGLTIQGAFPKRQEHFAQKLGKIVSNGFFSFDNIQQQISNPANLQKIMPMIEDHIDDFLRNKLSKEMPVIGMFIGDKTIGKLKEAFLKEIGLLFPQVMKEYAANMKDQLDMEKIIAEKVAAFSPDKLEEILHEEMHKELRVAEVSGAVIGLIIGLLQVIIIRLMA